MLFGEAMVDTPNPRLRESFPFLQKERGGLMAKGRLLGVQFEAAFEAPADGGEALYWRLARGANERALRLREGLVELGFKPYGDSASNQQFFVVTPAQRDALEAACGCETFYELSDEQVVVRFVCSWATGEKDVDELIALAGTLA